MASFLARSANRSFVAGPPGGCFLGTGFRLLYRLLGGPGLRTERDEFGAACEVAGAEMVECG
jgi:hypothetical protein